MQTSKMTELERKLQRDIDNKYNEILNIEITIIDEAFADISDLQEEIGELESRLRDIRSAVQT